MSAAARKKERGDRFSLIGHDLSACRFHGFLHPAAAFFIAVFPDRLQLGVIHIDLRGGRIIDLIAAGGDKGAGSHGLCLQRLQLIRRRHLTADDAQQIRLQIDPRPGAHLV